MFSGAVMSFSINGMNAVLSDVQIIYVLYGRLYENQTFLRCIFAGLSF